MAGKRTSRLYTRHQGGQDRYYADFRDYADVGGKQEALKVPGERRATTDPDVAAKLMADRLTELERLRRGQALTGVIREESLYRFAAEHLRKKAQGIRKELITEAWVEHAQMHLETAINFFGANTSVAAITVEDVQRYVAHLERLPTRRRAGTLSPGTQRKYLNSLSNLFRRAQSEGLVPPGYNPVAALLEKPTTAHVEAAWLEIPEATILLESARTFEPTRADVANPDIYEILGTFLLTGGRASEVLGLDVEDIQFNRQLVHFRPNAHRRLKTSTSRRTVPLWPQLEEILRAYVFGGPAPRAGLLFRSRKTGGMITDLRKILDAVAGRVGFRRGEVRTKAFRHTYCAARLQTLDRGAPVSPWTVAKEMGHGGRELVDRVYGHLGTIGERSEVVEYRAEHYLKELGEKIADLRAGV